MNRLELILIAFSLLICWGKLTLPFILKNYKELPKYKRPFKWILDRRPFSCALCMSFWLGLTLSYWENDYFLLTLPLFYHLYGRLDTKLI